MTTEPFLRSSEIAFNEVEQTIIVVYSCVECGLKNVRHAFKARGEESVLVWMEALISSLSQHHQLLSPGCKAKSLTELKIPLIGTDKVGGVANQ